MRHCCRWSRGRRSAHRIAYPASVKSGAAAVTATLVLAVCGAPAAIAHADPPAPSPAPKTTIDHDGTYAVGTEIVPGTYVSAGPVGDGACYWKRVGGPGGGDVVDNAMSKKAQVVQIDAGDKAFKTDGCQPWQVTDAPPPAGLPPLLAQAQLNAYMDTINSGARQSGAEQPPRP